MSPMSTSTSSAPTVTVGGDERSSHPGFQFGLVFWPILLGVTLIALIWGLWKWKAGLGRSTSPLATPKPPTVDVIRMARIRGAPFVGRPLEAIRATMPPPPPPVYVHPPQYDNTPPPYGGGTRPS